MNTGILILKKILHQLRIINKIISLQASVIIHIFCFYFLKWVILIKNRIKMREHFLIVKNKRNVPKKPKKKKNCQ